MNYWHRHNNHLLSGWSHVGGGFQSAGVAGVEQSAYAVAYGGGNATAINITYIYMYIYC